MRLKINGKEYPFPTSIKDITLWRRVQFQKEHGDPLKKELKRISEIKNETLRDMEWTVYHCDLACRNVSFFGGIPIDIIRNTDINDVFAVYNAVTKIYTEETDFTREEFKISHEVEWMDELWEIAPVELKQDSPMTFGEIVDSKQVVQNVYEFSEDRWEALLFLCCVFLRKKGEPYHKLLPSEDGERFKMMKELPLDIAFNVGFFLTDLISTYQSFSRSSSPPKPDLEATP